MTISTDLNREFGRKGLRLDSDSSVFRADYSRSKLLALAGLGGLFAFFGAVLVGAFGGQPQIGRYDPDYLFVVGWLAIIFFGGGAVVLIWLALVGGLALRIDKIGIFAPRMSGEPIPWTVIDGIGIIEFRGNRMLGFNVAKPHFLKIKTSAANRALTGFSNTISHTGTNKSHDEIVDAIKRFAPPSLTSAL